MSTRPTGRQFTLRRGDQEAVVTEVGAHLRRYRVGDRDIVVGFGADEEPWGNHGAVLLPWPNRLADGRYTIGGRDYQLPTNEPERHNALHGLVETLAWTPIAVTEESVTLELALPAREGYPFPLHATLAWVLAEDGLAAHLTTTNEGTDAAPYGAGFHPWLCPGGPVDACELSVDATGWVRTDERMLPVAVEEIPPARDFRLGGRIGQAELDDAYTPALHRTEQGEERSWAHLDCPDGWRLSTWMDATMTTWQVCTGDFAEFGARERTGVAVEPMTCAADAFNTGRDLVVLGPGASHDLSWGIVPQRP